MTGREVIRTAHPGTAERDVSVTAAARPNSNGGHIERASAPGLDEQPAPAR
jgi:hypothetical protein